MTDIIGSNITASIAICQTAGTSPSGDILWFAATQYAPIFVDNTPITHAAGRISFHTREATKYWKINFSAILLADVAVDLQTEYNNLKAKLEDWSDSGEAPVYFYKASKPFSLSPTKETWKDSLGNTNNYIAVKVKSLSPDFQKGDTYLAIKMALEECEF